VKHTPARKVAESPCYKVAIKYEDGTSEAPYEILKKIAQYYQVSIYYCQLIFVKVEVSDLLNLKITDSFPFKWIKWEKIGLKLLPKSKSGLLKRLCRSGIY
jgi:hypothetical protein